MIDLGHLQSAFGATEAALAARRVRFKVAEATAATDAGNCRRATAALDEAFMRFTLLLRTRRAAGETEYDEPTRALLFDLAKARVAFGRRCGKK